MRMKKQRKTNKDIARRHTPVRRKRFRNPWDSESQRDETVVYTKTEQDREEGVVRFLQSMK